MLKYICNKATAAESEKGEIMIESMIVVIITMLVLVWLMGLGFLYYQRYLAVVAVNDAAVKVAASFNNPTSDIVMGYTETKHLVNRDLYRGFTSSSLKERNEVRAQAYIRYQLDKLNFAGTVGDVTVKLDLINDSLVRQHVQLTAQCEFETPFGIGLEVFGMDATRYYTITACADRTDPADYFSTVGFIRGISTGRLISGGKIADSLLAFLGSIVSVYNKAEARVK